MAKSKINLNAPVDSPDAGTVRSKQSQPNSSSTSTQNGTVNHDGDGSSATQDLTTQLENASIAGKIGPFYSQDYQMQLLLLEQQEKRRLLMEKEKQDGIVEDTSTAKQGPDATRS